MHRLSLRMLGAMVALLSASLGAEAGIARQFCLPLTPDSSATLTCFLPTTPTGRAVVCCPGGGYAMLAMDHEGLGWADYFTGQGIALCVLKYRMPHGDRSLPFADAWRAMETVRDSARAWHVNPYDVGIMGSSAGGHLASTVSTHADFRHRPNFSILFYPVITMDARKGHAGSTRNLLGSEQDSASVVSLYSNQMQVRRHLTPPAIILCSNDDRTVPPVTNGVAYYSEMRLKGNACALHIYATGGHGWGIRNNFAYHDQMLADLTAWLRQLPSPREDAVRVACVGNSITDGTGADMRSVYGYPGQLQRLLGSGYHVKNYGVGARTMLQQGDYPYMRELAWQDAQAFQPQIVVIKLGTNDTKRKNWRGAKAYAHDMQLMIDTLRSLPSRPKIYLVYPLVMQHCTWASNEVVEREIMPAIDSLARKNGCEVIDMRRRLDDAALLTSDGVHPNAKGYAEMARAVAEAIRK